MLRYFGLLMAMITASAQAAAQQTMQITCGALDGHGYYAASPFVPEEEVGWREERIDGESLLRITIAGESGLVELDYKYKDATGIWADPSDHGGIVELAAYSADPFAVIVMVLYSGSVVEVLNFSLNDDLSITQIMTSNKANGLFTTGRTLIGECHMTIFD